MYPPYIFKLTIRLPPCSPEKCEVTKWTARCVWGCILSGCFYLFHFFREVRGLRGSFRVYVTIREGTSLSFSFVNAKGLCFHSGRVTRVVLGREMFFEWLYTFNESYFSSTFCTFAIDRYFCGFFRFARKMPLDSYLVGSACLVFEVFRDWWHAYVSRVCFLILRNCLSKN